VKTPIIGTELFKKAPAKQRSFSKKLQQNNGAFQKSSSKTTELFKKAPAKQLKATTRLTENT
jgi:sulfur relay (sulfurtransferase) DsrC/TusE family protein